MADTQSPPPEDMHWGISYLREDLQDVKHDVRDFRKEVAVEFSSFRTEVAQEFSNVRTEFAEFRKEVAQQFAEHRREAAQQLRHNLMVTLGVVGIFATIIIAFIQYKLPGG